MDHSEYKNINTEKRFAINMVMMKHDYTVTMEGHDGGMIQVKRDEQAVVRRW